MTAQKGKDLLLKVDTNGAGSFVTVASNIPSTPSGDIAATNVDAAIAELAGEKAPKASLTFTGLVTAPALVSGGPVSIADDGVADLGAIATSVRVMLVMMSGGAGNIGWYRIGGGLGIVFLDGTIVSTSTSNATGTTGITIAYVGGNIKIEDRVGSSLTVSYVLLGGGAF